MNKKPTLKQKIKYIKKLNCLLGIVSTITILGTIILPSLAFVFKQYCLELFVSGAGCFMLLVVVNNFQMRVFHEENVLHIKQYEESIKKDKEA